MTFKGLRLNGAEICVTHTAEAVDTPTNAIHTYITYSRQTTSWYVCVQCAVFSLLPEQGNLNHNMYITCKLLHVGESQMKDLVSFIYTYVHVFTLGLYKEVH